MCEVKYEARIFVVFVVWEEHSASAVVSTVTTERDAEMWMRGYEALEERAYTEFIHLFVWPADGDGDDLPSEVHRALRDEIRKQRRHFGGHQDEVASGEYSDTFRRLRVAADLSLRAVAESAGISHVRLSEIERRVGDPCTALEAHVILRAIHELGGGNCPE